MVVGDQIGDAFHHDALPGLLDRGRELGIELLHRCQEAVEPQIVQFGADVELAPRVAERQFLQVSLGATLAFCHHEPHEAKGLPECPLLHHEVRAGKSLLDLR